MSRLVLDFQPIETIPEEVYEAVLRGGVMDSAAKHRPYHLATAWRDDDGRWWVGRGGEIEIIGPTEWAPAPEPIYEIREPKPPPEAVLRRWRRRLFP